MMTQSGGTEAKAVYLDVFIEQGRRLEDRR